ncbi:MAG: hypothetical protein IJY59_06110 [Bacteroidaceae bacterium]|nr:hypothetical protein [Bacteroidaceae bacterium]
MAGRYNSLAIPYIVFMLLKKNLQEWMHLQEFLQVHLSKSQQLKWPIAGM